MSSDRAPLIDLHGRIAIVTGAGRGIGYATARRLGQAGASVTLADIDPLGEGAAAKLRAEGIDARFARLDVTNPADHEAVADQVARATSRLDIWVNNAGIYPSDALLELSDDAWRRVIDVNLSGTFYGARAAARHMSPRGTGVIVNLASVSAFRVAGDGRSHYAASKGGVMALTRALARELGPSGVRAVAIAPTAIETEGLLGGHDADDGFIDAYARTLPIGRLGSAGEVADVVLFAVSDLASLVTGSVIAADGGQLAV